MSDMDREAAFDAFNAQARRAAWQLRGDSGLAFESPQLREALASWTAQAGTARWPSRAAMTPRVMKNYLAQLILFDVEREGGAIRYRVRIMGARMEEVFFHAPGRLIDEVVPEPLLAKWKAILDLALAVEGPIRMDGFIQFGNQHYLEAEEFFAPLGEPGRPADALLGVARIQPARRVSTHSGTRYASRA